MKYTNFLVSLSYFISHLENKGTPPFKLPTVGYVHTVEPNK